MQRDPVVLLMARARRHEPTGSRLFRGMTREGIGGGGVHHGGVVQHCVDIAHGSSQAARGTSLTKEPVVAAAYGHQQHVACVRRDGLAVHKLHDFAGATGQAQLSAAVTQAARDCSRAPRMARADAEVRYDDNVPEPALQGPPYAPVAEHAVRAGYSKGQFAAQLSSAARDALLGWASACEGRLPARASTHDAAPGQPPDGPVVRLTTHEADANSLERTGVVARQLLRLHARHAFTHACATDGGGTPVVVGADGTQLAGARVSWGVWRSEHSSWGGALPAGNTPSAQDGEMAAITSCLRHTADSCAERPGCRLLIASDSRSSLLDIERVWRRGDGWAIRNHHRRAMHTQIVADRRRLARQGGVVIFYWLRGHSGVLCNQYADAVATAFLTRTAQEDAHLQPRDTERHGAAMVRYVIRAGSLAEPSGGWLSVPADRRPRGLALPRLAEWSVLKLGGYDPMAVTWRLPEGLHLDQAVLLGGRRRRSTGRACFSSSRSRQVSTSAGRGHRTLERS